MIRTMFHGTNLSTYLWPEAHRYAVYVFNRIPKAAIGFKTPFEARYNQKPDFSTFHMFRSKVYNKELGQKKLSAQAFIGNYLGPDEESNRYRIWNPKKRTVQIERDVVFSTGHRARQAQERRQEHPAT